MEKIMAKPNREEVIKSITEGNKDFQGWDLKSLDLSNLYLSCLNFSNSILKKANLNKSFLG